MAHVTNYLAGNQSMTSTRGLLACCFGVEKGSNADGKEPIVEYDDHSQDSDDDESPNRKSLYEPLATDSAKQYNSMSETKKTRNDDSEDSDDEVKDNFNFISRSDSSIRESLRKKSVQIPETDLHSLDQSGLEDSVSLSSQNYRSGQLSRSTSLGGPDSGSTGVVEVGIRFEAKKSRLVVRVIQLLEVPGLSASSASDLVTRPTVASLEDSDPILAYQVHLTLLPGKKQRVKTKNRAPPDLKFDEEFIFNKISESNFQDTSLRIRLYGSKKTKLAIVLGHSIVPLNTLSLGPTEQPYNFTMNKGCDDSTSMAGDVDGISVAETQEVPVPASQEQELSLGMTYNSTTGRLSVEILKAIGLKAPTTQKPPDTYVKMTLMSAAGHELAHSKTSIRKATSSPLYRETFVFQVPLFQLAEVTLMITVYHKKSVNRKDMIGWFSLGKKSTGDEEEAHWNDMKQSPGEQITRWHSLLQST